MTNEDIASMFTCLVCNKEYTTEYSLRSHKRHCKGPSDNRTGPKTPVAPSIPAAPVTPAAPADPMADKICPACCKMCKGTRGLASHRRTCQGQPDAASYPGVASAAGDVEQPQDAEALDSVNPDVVDKEQSPLGHIDSRIPCSKRVEIFRTERDRRTHDRRSKRSAVHNMAPVDPLADQVCPTGVKMCRGMRSLRLHRRACQEQTDAVAAAGPNIDGAAADSDAEVTLPKGKRRRRSKIEEHTNVSAHTTGNFRMDLHQASCQWNRRCCIPPCSSWQQNKRRPTYQLCRSGMTMLVKIRSSNCDCTSYTDSEPIDR